MNSSPGKSGLPNKLAALRFVCDCFGVGEKDIAETLERMRKITPNANESFPKKISRVMLMRAASGKGAWQNALLILHREALYDRIRRRDGEPMFSFTSKVTDEIITSLLKLYERLLPKLDVSGVAKPEAMWLMVENVFMPTVFIKLIEEWRWGLGTELQGEKCWYFPIRRDGIIVKPVSRVLDCWLRAAGFRTAYGVSHSLSRGKAKKSTMDHQTVKFWDAWKKSVERWLNGDPVKSMSSLHRLVRGFSQNVSWLDDANNWNARFTLAFGMQNLCDAMDEFFNEAHVDSSLMLADMFQFIADEGIVSDEEKILSKPHTFFATRLLQRRLQIEEGQDKTNRMTPNSPSSETSGEEFEKVQQQMHEGNHLLEFIINQAISDGRLDPEANSVGSYISLESYIFEIGVIELNHLLALKRQEAGKS